MNETPLNTASSPIPEQLLPSGSSDQGEVSYAHPEEAAERRAAFEGWLERRDIDPAGTPYLAMGRREFDLLNNAPSNYQSYVLRRYEIPQDDQTNCQYALVDVTPEGSNLPPRLELMTVNEADFGTIIDFERTANDFQSPEEPEDPEAPNRPGDAYRTVDIRDALVASSEGLQMFTEELMKGITVDPLSEHYGDIGVRAGELIPDQRDAYVWTTSPFAKSVELTIAFPSQYDSVCIVRGERREAANGKAGMAQIVNPVEVLKIEGDNLKDLQRVYQDLYYEPGFALTKEQGQGRDKLFNAYLAQQISDKASKNRAAEQARQDDERRRRQQPLRAREIRRS